jgi:mono/diheme cytochrome c family protein
MCASGCTGARWPHKFKEIGAMSLFNRRIPGAVALALWLVPFTGFAADAPAAASAATRQLNPNVDVPEFPSLSSETDGKKLFETICQGCHMPDAKGAKGAGMYPALAANPKLVAPAYPLFVVLNGLRGMPNIGKALTDAQVAAVVNYVIRHFGNSAPAQTTAEEVKAARASQ